MWTFPTTFSPKNLPFFSLFYLRSHFLWLLSFVPTSIFPSLSLPPTHACARPQTPYAHFPALTCLSPHRHDTISNWCCWSEQPRDIWLLQLTQHVGLLGVPSKYHLYYSLEVPSGPMVQADYRAPAVVPRLSHGIIMTRHHVFKNKFEIERLQKQ